MTKNGGFEDFVIFFRNFQANANDNQNYESELRILIFFGENSDFRPNQIGRGVSYMNMIEGGLDGVHEKTHL